MKTSSHNKAMTISWNGEAIEECCGTYVVAIESMR